MPNLNESPMEETVVTGIAVQLIRLAPNIDHRELKAEILALAKVWATMVNGNPAFFEWLVDSALRAGE